MTLIKNATIKRTATGATAAKDTDMLAIGTPDGNESVAITLADLKLWMGSITDKISAGDSKVQVIDTGHGRVDVTIDNDIILSILKDRIIPSFTPFDIGDSNFRFKDLYISGAINLGSDATGDIYYRDNDHLIRLQIGASGKVLKSNGIHPVWGDSSESMTNVDRISLDANTPLNITFANPFSSGSNYDVVLLTNGYDSNGNPVVVTITNITTIGFTAEASTACLLHYYASIKPSSNK